MVFRLLLNIKKTVIAAFICCLFSFSYAKNAYPFPFEKLATLKGQQKLDSAYLIFYRNQHEWDSLQGTPIFQKLLALAEEEGNEAEQIFFLNEMAFWYAYGRKMGAKHQKAIKISQQALEKAEESRFSYWIAYTHNQLGNLYNTISETEKAVEHYWEARLLFQQIGYSKSPWMKEFLFDWAKFNYFQFYQADTMLHYLRQATAYKCLHPRKNIETPNLMGILYKNDYSGEIKNYDSALIYFQKALELARIYKDTAWIGIAMGNLGATYEFKKEYELALKYYEEDAKISQKYGETLEIITNSIQIANTNRLLGRLELAYKIITEAEKLKDRPKDTMYVYSFYMIKAWILYDMGRYKEAYEAYRKNYELEMTQGRLKRTTKTAQAKLSLYQKIYLREKELLEQNKRNAVLLRNSIIGFLFAILIIVWILYNRRQMRNNAEKELLEQKNLLALSEQKRIADELKAEKELLEQKALLASSEQKRIEAELENARIQLANYVENLLQKNEIIERAAVELSKYEKQNVLQTEKISLDELYNARLSTEEDWVKFKILFDKVYPHFLDGLRNRIKDITPADLRLIALTKLNIRGKEMATMLGISYDSVRKAKYRLKKKMEQLEYLELKDIFENTDN